MKDFIQGADCSLGELASLLIQLREYRGISQRQLADTAGVNRSVVSRVENGQDARLSTWLRLFRGLSYEIRIDFCESSEEASDLQMEEKDRRLQRQLDGLEAGKRRFY